MSQPTLAAFLENLAAERPADTALIERERAVSYAQLDQESKRIASALAELGVAAGMRVAIWLPNLPAWLAVFFACARLGAIAVSVNTRYKRHEVEGIAARSGCRALVYWPDYRNIDFGAILAACDPAAMRTLNTVVAYGEGGTAGAVHETMKAGGRNVTGYADLLKAPPLDADFGLARAGCVMFTTSGTTKAPKFVLHDQATIVAHAQDVARVFGYLEPGARVLLSAPLCGVFGFCNAMAALAARAPLVMYPDFDATQSAAGILRHRVTHTNCTDDMLAQMLAAVDATPAFPSARCFGFAAFSPAQAGLAARAEARGLRLVGLYGSSELQALFARQDAATPISQRALAGGKPVAGSARVRARDPESGALLPHGTPGELEFLAPSIMAGYFEDEAATAAAFAGDGWFKSGDFGYTTDGGFVFVARLGDAIRISGFLVSPAEIEDVLQSHDRVAAAQVVAALTPEGLKPVAFVILKPGAGLDEAALAAFCRSRIAGFKVPVRIAALEAFPQTAGANGMKVQKSRLREMAQALLAPAGTA